MSYSSSSTFKVGKAFSGYYLLWTSTTILTVGCHFEAHFRDRESEDEESCSPVFSPSLYLSLSLLSPFPSLFITAVIISQALDYAPGIPTEALPTVPLAV